MKNRITIDLTNHQGLLDWIDNRCNQLGITASAFLRRLIRKDKEKGIPWLVQKVNMFVCDSDTGEWLQDYATELKMTVSEAVMAILKAERKRESRGEE